MTEVDCGPRMLRVAEVVSRTGLSRTSLWRRLRAGDFPRPIQLGPNSVGWRDSEIEAWLESRPRRTYGADTAAKDGS